ncbi:hypothetical protein AB1Y20_022955 [Prymnesium parvum]|uniref:Hydroxyproline O-arabinosyltransferase-like domain-containing protein n=1 Tax=Prymnesium parvum TaxID=97485 RepID=A0AB34JE43_PRYPA
MKVVLQPCALAVGILVLGGLLLVRDQLLAQSTSEPDVADLLLQTRRMDAKLERLTASLENLQAELSKPVEADRDASRVSEVEPGQLLELTQLQDKVKALERSLHSQVKQGNSQPHAESDAAGSEKGGSTLSQTADVRAEEAAIQAKCPKRSPFHGLMTAQASVYQQWQARIMYYHWKKQKALGGECTDMAGFTRLAATEGGKPDGLESEIPSVFVEQLSEEVMMSHFHFGVLNRPHSILKLLASSEMLEQLTSSFVLILETDHVIMKPIPNLATPRTPAGWVFGYMHGHAGQDSVVKKYWPEGSGADLDPVGPSPLLIHLDQLRLVAPRWMEFSLGLRSDKSAERVMQGWVQEMWGYTIAAASLGIKHRLVREMQVEASSLSHNIPVDFPKMAYIFHYTYGIEYTADGKPQGINQIGEWSLDKRHYGGDHPPRNLEPPPDGANAAARWLLNAWNEASANIPNWPQSKSMGTYGWRRQPATAATIARSGTATRVVGTRWTWAGNEGFDFLPEGQLKTPWGVGTWGIVTSKQSANDGRTEDGIFKCTDCLFADFANANHNLRFNFDVSPYRFTSHRVGDMAEVNGEFLRRL